MAVEMVEGILSHLLGALLAVCQCCTPFEVLLYGHSVVPEFLCKYHFRAVLQKDGAVGLGVCFVHILLSLMVTNAESNRGTWKTIKTIARKPALPCSPRAASLLDVGGKFITNFQTIPTADISQLARVVDYKNYKYTS